MSRISAIVPCYNGEAGVHELHRRLSAACKAAVGGAYELIYVNDGSSDGTLARLHELAAHDPHVVVVNLTRNFGHQLALSAGLTVCRNELVFVLDDDLQDPPELLTPMLQLIEEGADVVYGQRRARAGESVFKKASAVGVLSAARPHVGGPRSARHRRFPAYDSAGRRCVECDARAAPIHTRHGQLGRLSPGSAAL